MMPISSLRAAGFDGVRVIQLDSRWPSQRVNTRRSSPPRCRSKRRVIVVQPRRERRGRRGRKGGARLRVWLEGGGGLRSISRYDGTQKEKGGLG